MKSIYVVRHAKSSWGDLTVSDFDRPLSDRGQRNAPEMAQRLLSKGISIDQFISSTAKRALQTAIHFIKVYRRNPEEIILHEELYHAPANIYFDVITALDNKLSSIAIFGHNPGITEFVNQLTEKQIDDMPTCGIFAAQLAVKDWKNFRSTHKEFLFFDRPRDGS